MAGDGCCWCAGKGLGEGECAGIWFRQEATGGINVERKRLMGKEEEEKTTEDGDVFQQSLILRSCQLMQILCVPGCQARQTRR